MTTAENGKTSSNTSQPQTGGGAGRMHLENFKLESGQKWKEFIL